MYYRQPKYYYVYIMTNRSKTLSTGVTNNLKRRVWQHKYEHGSEFTSHYKCDRLVYYEEVTDIHCAISREKQIKGFCRSRRLPSSYR